MSRAVPTIAIDDEVNVRIADGSEASTDWTLVSGTGREAASAFRQAKACNAKVFAKHTPNLAFRHPTSELCTKWLDRPLEEDFLRRSTGIATTSLTLLAPSLKLAESLSIKSVAAV